MTRLVGLALGSMLVLTSAVALAAPPGPGQRSRTLHRGSLSAAGGFPFGDGKVIAASKTEEGENHA